jgi:hypothetical protein
MATGTRRRTACQECGERCQASPLEALSRSTYEGHRVRIWTVRYLCPVCRLCARQAAAEQSSRGNRSPAPCSFPDLTAQAPARGDFVSASSSRSA